MAKPAWSDYYTKQSPWYWTLQFVVTLYGMGALAYLVLIQNSHVVNTVFNSLPGGTYYSWRYVTFVWWALMLSCAKVLTYPFVNAAILFRGTRGCTIFWHTLLALLVIIDVVVMVGLGTQYAGCNMNGEPGNICNDPRYCCALEIYTVTSNGCFNNFACTPPVTLSELQPNADFLWLFWTNFTFLIVDMLIFLFFSLSFMYCPVYTLSASALDDDDDWSDSDGDDSEFAKDPPPPPPGADDGTITIPPPKGGGAAAVDMRAMSPTRATTMQRKK